MARLEFAMLGRRCRGRRTPDRGTLSTERAAWLAARIEQWAAIYWQFTDDNVWVKLQRLYPS